jgi:antitoxin (DNA-binding transcriptional repressor) of toxin-antitoxin stability system
VGVMTVIPQKELRYQIGAVLRRVEAGETMIVTVSARQVAELSPANRRRWVTGDAMLNDRCRRARGHRGGLPGSSRRYVHS